MTILTRRRFSTLAGSALLLPALPSFAQSNPSLAALHEAARKEGELTWYMTHLPSEEGEQMASLFTKTYPGVKVNVVRTTAQIAYQRLNQDLRAGVANCDVFGSTDIGHYVELKQKKLLLKYVPAGEALMHPVLRGVDPDGYFVTTSASLISLLYNTNKVKAADAPKSWTDLLAPKWQGQASVGHPGFSGYVGTWAVEMKKLFGDDFFKKLAANKPQVGRSIIDTVTTLISGERSISAGPASLAYLQAAKGNPIGVSLPSEGSVLMILPSAIMANAKHPNAAKLFLEWLTGSDEANQFAYNDYAIPLRASTGTKPPMPGLGQTKTVRPSNAEIVTGIPAVTELWRDAFGV
ncbi:MAG: extracellular solute-binding protein [Pseudomonadota bacterium]|nr:extracellular solute-binding protein [Pseudomonadota bacterium]